MTSARFRRCDGRRMKVASSSAEPALRSVVLGPEGVVAILTRPQRSHAVEFGDGKQI